MSGATASGTDDTGATGSPKDADTSSPSQVPHYSHIVVVILENRGYGQVTDSAQTPFLDLLSQEGIRLTDMHALTHPSQPNYLALFSGSTQHVTDESCPHQFTSDNLAHQLASHALTFTGYAENLPAPGYTGCGSGLYTRSHAPWTNFRTVTTHSNQPLTAFPTNFTTLPTVAFISPNTAHDMHAGTLTTADSWLADKLQNYSTWAITHHSLLIITFDEDNGTTVNHIPTVLEGGDLIPGTVDTPATPYTLLRLIDDAERLPPLGAARTATPITSTWQQ